MELILGTKLKKARENAGLTQDALAKAVGLSSEFICLLESGKRTPSLETLTNLSEYLKKDISYFFKEKDSAFNLLFQGEKLDKKAKRELRRFQKYCDEYVQLEELTERRLRLAPLYTHISAERMAEEERCRIGLRNEPIRDIFSLLEVNGCRIIRQPIPEESQISGVFIFLEKMDAAFALINSSQSPGRQAFTAAHEYCHYLKDRNEGPVVDNPDIFVDEFLSLYHPREKFAQTFATRFLIPASKVKEIIEKDIRTNKLKYEDVVYLKRYFGVSFLAMLRTLKDLGYLLTARFEEYRKIDLEPYEASLFGSLIQAKRQKKKKGETILSDRFRSLAIKAYQKKKISAEKLSMILHQDKDRLLRALGESK